MSCETESSNSIFIFENKKLRTQDVQDLQFDNPERVRVLYLNNNLIKVLQLPHLPSLQVLDLSDNKLTDQGLDCLKNLRNLKELQMSGNQIRSLETIDSLAGLQNLAKLELYNCPVCEIKNFFEYCFKKIKSL